jgi:hypothetical protein
VDIDVVVKKLLAEGKYAIDLEHIERGKNISRRILASDVLHVLFSNRSRHYKGDSLDKKLVIFSEGSDTNDRIIRVVSRLIDSEGEIIISVIQAEFSEILFIKTAYEIEGV